MNNNNKHSTVSDVDQTNDSLLQQPPSYYAASSSSTQPSAPTQYDLIPTSSPPLQQQTYYNNYQTMPQPQPYHTIEIPARYIIRRKESDYKRFPLQASVFLLGCLVNPAIWVIALCLPKTNRYEIAWRKLNICMLYFFSIISIIVCIIFGFAAYEDYKQKHSDPDPVWRIPGY